MRVTAADSGPVRSGPCSPPSGLRLSARGWRFLRTHAGATDQRGGTLRQSLKGNPTKVDTGVITLAILWAEVAWIDAIA